MKKLFLMAIAASMTIGAVAATSQANAGYNTDYATEYCRYYKNKAVWTGDPGWWAAYYACLKDKR
ncbi:MAG TPA: hypothetical protein ENJ55_06450 [Rhizobiales bacterium]|nr:hypothetical protein [Hyphomicrobiales bacterium]